jgi:hypothetical protein
MDYYYRKPRDMSLENVSSGTLQRVLRPFSLTETGLVPLPPQVPMITPGQGALAGEPAQSAAMRDAAALVRSAASILDEDMAAGVLAARDARSTGAAHQATQTGNDGDRRQLLRNAHDFVDAIAAVLPQAQHGVPNWLKARQPAVDDTNLEGITLLCPSAPVQAGQIAKISMKLHNDNTSAARLVPYCTQLLTSSGYRIPEDQMTFTPRELPLGPDEFADVVLEVRVPGGSDKGSYAGVVMVSGAPYLRAVFAIEVV